MLLELALCEQYEAYLTDSGAHILRYVAQGNCKTNQLEYRGAQHRSVVRSPRPCSMANRDYRANRHVAMLLELALREQYEAYLTDSGAHTLRYITQGNCITN